jgi:glutamine synthetase
MTEQRAHAILSASGSKIWLTCTPSAQTTVNRYLTEGTQISDPYDTAEKPCYDQQAVMRRYDVIAEACDYMLELGWEAYQNDHEDAIGQFEMNWKYDDAMQTADKHSFFKFMVKSIAEKHGLRATFMPKPFINLTGNGCHVHLSVWDKDAKKAVGSFGKRLDKLVPNKIVLRKP